MRYCEYLVGDDEVKSSGAIYRFLLRLKQSISGSTQRRIDGNALANDPDHFVPVNVRPERPEFERVISRQRSARFRWKQPDPSLNVQPGIFGAVDFGIPQLDSGFAPAP